MRAYLCLAEVKWVKTGVPGVKPLLGVKGWILFLTSSTMLKSPSIITGSVGCTICMSNMISLRWSKYSSLWSFGTYTLLTMTDRFLPTSFTITRSPLSDLYKHSPSVQNLSEKKILTPFCLLPSPLYVGNGMVVINKTTSTPKSGWGLCTSNWNSVCIPSCSQIKLQFHVRSKCRCGKIKWADKLICYFYKMQYCILLRYINEPFVNSVIFLNQSLINFYTFVHFLCNGCHWFVKKTIKPFKNFFSYFVLFLSFIFCRNKLVGLKWSNYSPKLGTKIVIADRSVDHRVDGP